MMEGKVWQNLIDASCSAAFIEQYEALPEEEQLSCLQRHRRYLLDAIHDKQLQLDRLDYFLYVLRKRGDEGK